MKLLVHKRRDGTKKLPDQRNKGSIKRNKLACDRVKCNCCYACHIILEILSAFKNMCTEQMCQFHCAAFISCSTLLRIVYSLLQTLRWTLSPVISERNLIKDLSICPLLVLRQRKIKDACPYEAEINVERHS